MVMLANMVFVQLLFVFLVCVRCLKLLLPLPKVVLVEVERTREIDRCSLYCAGSCRNEGCGHGCACKYYDRSTHTCIAIRVLHSPHREWQCYNMNASLLFTLFPHRANSRS